MAIRAIAKSLERVDQKKSMLYFSGGLSRNGIENQASLRAATNEAAKANMAIYSSRHARVAGAASGRGSASSGSLRGNSAYSGRAVTAAFSANFASQETLGTLSMPTRAARRSSIRTTSGRRFMQVQHDSGGVLHPWLQIDQPAHSDGRLSPPFDQGESARCGHR